MTTETEVYEGQQAQYILDHPLTVRAFTQLESEIVEQWAECPLRDRDGQHELLLMLKVARKFKAIFHGYIDTGKLAEERAKIPDLRRSRAERLREAVGL